MFKIEPQEVDSIVHELISIASIIRNVENGNLSTGQNQLLKGCETRLFEIREHILSSLKNNEK